MIQAQFRIQLPETMWIAQVSQEFPSATFRLLSGYRLEETALELGEVITDTPERVVEAMRAQPSIRNYELLESETRRALGKYETADTDLYDFVELSSLTIEFPVGVRNGWYEFDLTGTREELDQFRDVLDGLSFRYELESLVTTVGTETLLTQRQREVLEVAVREGYFEVPRECTLAELADGLNIDKSTASTILRRGESALVTWFVTGPNVER